MESTSLNCTPYPPPETTYENVVADPHIFLAALKKLHSIMGTKFMTPIIGGKELDLHQLFVEVTSRGGIEKVVRDRKWKDVTLVFNFPHSATNASFVLRKYYISLLHHFEQIYYFKAVGWVPENPGSSSRARATTIPTQGVGSMLPPASRQAQTSSATQLPAVALSSASPQPVAGVIDGIFDGGYLITVTVGTEQLKGVLFEAITEQPVLQPGGGVVAKDGATSSTPRGRHRKSSEKKRRDPALPKSNRSGYNFFYSEQYVKLKPSYQGKEMETRKMIGELWNTLVESEKEVYHEKAMKSTERYKIEMGDHREKQRTGLVIRDAVPLQQIRAEPDLNTVDADKNKDTEVGTSQTSDRYTTHVEGDSGEFKTEDNEEENEWMEEEEDEWMEEEENKGACPQGVRKESITIGDDMDLNIEKEHCETIAATKDHIRKESSTVGDDMDLNILPEEEHCKTRAEAEEVVRKESSTVNDDTEVLTSESVMVEAKEAEEEASLQRVANVDVRKESSRVSDDKDINILVEEEHCQTRATAEEDVRKECSTVSDDTNVNILVEKKHSDTRVQTKENIRKESSTVSDDKKVLAGDSVRVEAKEEPEPTSRVIRED